MCEECKRTERNGSRDSAGKTCHSQGSNGESLESFAKDGGLYSGGGEEILKVGALAMTRSTRDLGRDPGLGLDVERRGYPAALQKRMEKG